HQASTGANSARPRPSLRLTSKKLSREDAVVFTMNWTSTPGKRARTRSTHARPASLTMITSEVTPAARKFVIADSISGTPATGTSGLGMAKPPARSRLPSPAAMIPAGNGAVTAGTRRARRAIGPRDLPDSTAWAAPRAAPARCVACPRRAGGVERRRDEARGDAGAHRRIRHAQPGAHAGHESMHRVAERERRRNRSHQGIVGAIEHRGEALGLNVHALLTVEVKDPLLPGHARGVQRSAEVEQHGVRCTHASGLS